MYLTGSRALKGEGADWDLVLEGELISPSPTIDIAPEGLKTLELCRHYETGETVDTPVGRAKLVDPLCVMLMKRSHLFRPLKFAKHIRDYHSLFKVLEHRIDDTYRNLLSERIKLTKLKYGDKHPSLKQKTNNFFDDAVKKYYVHDELHMVTCYGDAPIYEMLKPDKDMVWCSKDLWEQLPFDLKVKCVREEAFVIALERFMIPKIEQGVSPPPAKFAFIWALERICTNLTSGYFRDFAIDNWPIIMETDYSFYEKFKEWRNAREI